MNKSKEKAWEKRYFYRKFDEKFKNSSLDCIIFKDNCDTVDRSKERFKKFCLEVSEVRKQWSHDHEILVNAILEERSRDITEALDEVLKGPWYSTIIYKDKDYILTDELNKRIRQIKKRLN